MNLKSFPGPEPYIRVGGVEMVGETRDGGVGGLVEMGVCSQTFGGPLRASVGGTPATEVPKPGALAGAMGAGCPSCLLTLPSPCSTQSGQEGC